MGLFGRAKAQPSEDAAAPDGGLPIDLDRFDRLVQKTERLSEAGVGYDDVERRALRDAVSFNEALETLYRERFGG